MNAGIEFAERHRWGELWILKQDACKKLWKQYERKKLWRRGSIDIEARKFRKFDERHMRGK